MRKRILVGRMMSVRWWLISIGTRFNSGILPSVVDGFLILRVLLSFPAGGSERRALRSEVLMVERRSPKPDVGGFESSLACMREEIEKAIKVLDRWELAAKVKKNAEALAQTKLIRKVIKDLSGM